MLNYYRALHLPLLNLGRITVLSPLLWGIKDRFFGRHLAEGAAGLWDKVRLVYFDDATYRIHHEKPERVADELVSFVAKIG